MLIVPCGKPFTIESRPPPAVCTPGRNTMKSAAPRLESGRLCTWRVSSVVEIAAVCVWTIWLVDCTTTCSLMPPTSSTARTLAGTPELTTTLFRTAVLNPWSDTVTVYVPVMSDGTEKTPPPDVTAVNVSLVPLFLTTTSAPGTTPPPESTTTPEMDAVEEPWAKAPTLVRHASSVAPARPSGRCVIASSSATNALQKT